MAKEITDEKPAAKDERTERELLGWEWRAAKLLLANLNNWVKEDGMDEEFIHDLIWLTDVTEDKFFWALEHARLNVSK
jgi:hypothetical protein